MAVVRNLLLCTLAYINCSAAETVWLDALDLSLMRQSYGQPQTNQAMRGTPLSISGKRFERGVGTHANSSLWIDLAKKSESFHAVVGVDDAAGGVASVSFHVIGDGRKLFESGVIKAGMAGRVIEVDLRGVKTLLLQALDGADGISYDHANWADARFTFASVPPKAIGMPPEEGVVLTPKPGPAPRINGPTIYGCRPGNPFLYRIPTQGERPIEFKARKMPKSLMLDRDSGIISGFSPEAGEYHVTLEAKNRHGKATRLLRIKSVDKLALTPPMGWNHWYAHYDRITDQMMREAADLMVSRGMADVGYQYVNIDDCWMTAPKHSDPLRMGRLRDSDGNLLPNKYFPNMKGLTDHIHAKGLKAGIYTSPGPLTCAGFAGSFGYEAKDAAQFAEWGFDFVKYDWCSYGHIAEGGDPKATKVPTWGKGAATLEAHMYPYRLMGDLLKDQKRDIILNLCQYGMANVWEWGEAVGGHCWRTAGDLGFELDRIFEVALKNAQYRDWSKPGAWNDPDYVQIGWVGDARATGLPKPCPLTPNEQYSYMSLWVLMAAPLFYSGDMTQLDEFTLNVLCNPEVIEVNQDALGESARVLTHPDDTFLMVKDLEDGSKAVGIFNKGEFEQKVAVDWSHIGLIGRQRVRDLWRQKDLGVFASAFSAEIPRHGTSLLRIYPEEKQSRRQSKK